MGPCGNATDEALPRFPLLALGIWGTRLNSLSSPASWWSGEETAGQTGYGGGWAGGWGRRWPHAEDKGERVGVSGLRALKKKDTGGRAWGRERPPAPSHARRKAGLPGAWAASGAQRDGTLSAAGLLWPLPPRLLGFQLRWPQRPTRGGGSLGGAGWRRARLGPGPLFRKGGTDFSSRGSASHPTRLPAPGCRRGFRPPYLGIGKPR